MWAEDRPSSRRKHKIAAFSQVFQNCGFSLSESRLALDIENVRDGNASAALYLLITIDECLAKLLC